MNEHNSIAIQLNGQKELERFALSDDRWAKDKPKMRSQRDVKKGDLTLSQNNNIETKLELKNQNICIILNTGIGSSEL